jgi:hypothetical protein
MKLESAKVKRMDRRMVGHNIMKYHVDFSTLYGIHLNERLELFYKVMRWCETQYGPTRPLNDLQSAMDYNSTASDINSKWTWLRDEFRTKIMFADAETAAHYTLVFGV